MPFGEQDEDKGEWTPPLNTLLAKSSTSIDIESSEPYTDSSGYDGDVEDQENCASLPYSVESYKSTDNLDKDTCNRLLAAFEIYYDYGEGFSKETNPHVSRSSDNILSHIESILHRLGIDAIELRPKYRAVVLSETIIVHLVKGRYEEGLQISEKALELAKKENLVGLTLRIHSYRNALYRDQRLFGLAERERIIAAQIYSAVNSFTDRTYFHFNAGKEKVKYLAVCHRNAYKECSEHAVREFELALYFASLEIRTNQSSFRDALEKVIHGCLVQLSVLQEDEKEGAKYLLTAFKREMPLLPKIYYVLACSDIFQRAKLVEESYIFALWCHIKCVEHRYNTELKMAEQRVQKYKGILTEEQQAKLYVDLDGLFKEKFGDVLKLLHTISNIGKQQSIKDTTIADEVRFAQTEDSETLDNSLSDNRFQTTESETGSKKHCRMSQLCIESGEETVPTSGTEFA